ncbi:MAG: hypothetical protein RLZZ292_1873 [Bacteroidota bacterium]|jgi:hypothetical protein
MMQPIGKNYSETYTFHFIFLARHDAFLSRSGILPPFSYIINLFLYAKHTNFCNFHRNLVSSWRVGGWLLRFKRRSQPANSELANQLSMKIAKDFKHLHFRASLPLYLQTLLFFLTIFFINNFILCFAKNTSEKLLFNHSTMTIKALLRFAFAIALFAIAPLSLWAQVTSAAINGLISSTKGEELIGATVVAVHTPSGSEYGTVTRQDGRFTLPAVRVGGPYTITVSYVGFETQKLNGIMLSLGQKFTTEVKLKEASSTIGEVVVTAEPNSVINSDRTGAATNISGDQIRALPTISRSASDYTRLTPSSDGNSFGGRNDQYNNFSLDGATLNNPFGLDAATAGGQSDAQPVSLDAIDQIQVSIAPYDVTQAGFTGAAVNAVTKSGTNDFKGTAYGFFRNQNMTSGKVADVEVAKNKLNQGQYGISIGGPIIKNKLFFFANAEIERRSDIGTAGWIASRPGLSGGNVSRVAAADLDAVRSALKSIGYETGDYENFTHKTNNQKGLIKLDWNINQSNHLTATYNTLDAYKEKPAHPSAIGRRGPDYTTLQFYNSGYRINNKLQSVVVDLKTLLGSKISNDLQIGATKFTDTRDPFSSAAPSINIGKDGSRYIIAGHEPFSIFNRLNQRMLQAKDNVTIYLKKHTVTVGAGIEQFTFGNAFNLGTYGGTFGPGYGSVQSFLDSVKSGEVARNIAGAKATEKFNSVDDNRWSWYHLKVGQASVYAQDEFQASKNLTITAGIRIDKPLYFDTQDSIKAKLAKSAYKPEIQYYDEVGTPVKFDHTVLPSNAPLISPRLGFNWDVKGDKTMQLRGGSGLFTGRLPFVWIGNHVGNPNFYFYCVTKSDFKFPQVWRSNLGYDQKFGEGFTLSADLIYTQDLNGMMVRNYGLKLPGGTLSGPDKRPIYRKEDRATVFGGSTDAFVFTNTNIGNSTNVSLQLQKSWKSGGYAMLGYNYGLSQDASSIEAEISSDAYDRNPAYGNVNTAVLSPSLYGNLHRVVGAATKKISYANGKMATTVSAFFQAAKGGRFSYTYGGDINNDGSGNNDLIYIPSDADLNSMAFTNDAQKAAFKSFIEQDDYLSTHRGEVMQKYGILSPWYSNVDIRVMQDFNVKVAGRNNTIQLSLDILNAGNLVNSNWGVRQLPANTQPVGVSVKDGVPTYSFDTNLKSTFVNDFSLLSRWQAQVGLRYIF